jgi:hypothetical protein
VELGDSRVKIKDIIVEEERVRDPYSYDYEKDPETGEYTGRTEPDRGPGMFTQMLQKHASDIPSFYPSDQQPQKQQIKNRTNVPQGKRLVTQTRDGRIYYKYPASPNNADKSGQWSDAGGRPIVSIISIDALEKLAKSNGKFEDLAAEPVQTDQTADQPEDKPAPEIIIPEPSRRRKQPAPEEPAPAEPIAVEPDEPMSLVDQPLAKNERIAVDTPAGTFYKYSDGNWYQIPTTGTPVRARYDDYEILDDYANKEGYVEEIPPTPKKRGRK